MKDGEAWWSTREVTPCISASAAPTAEASYDDCYMNASACKDNEIIALWDIASIKADPESCGLAGSPTKVKKIDSVVLTAQDIRMIDNSESAIGSLVHELIADHTIG